MDIQEINQSSPEFLYQMLGRTVEAAIKHLGGSRRETILPDGRVVIPESVNYPELVIRNIFVPFSAVRAEVWPGEPGWGK